MGESYLQRKLAGVKKLPVQTSSSSESTSAELIGRPATISNSQQLNLIRQTSAGSSLSSCSLPATSAGEPPRAPTSRLKSAARAIFFFRRAASSSTSTNARQPPLSQSGDALSSMSRQNTADSNQSTGGGGGELPAQFLVPKMNALRLPLVCRIRSVEGELMREVFVHRYELAQYLIESLKVSLGLQDAKYFGLKMAKSVDEQDDLRNQWLDLNESVCKQIKSKQSANQQASRSIDFYLRIKFYPPNLTRVQDPFLRQYLWMQLRRDLRLGKLTSSMGNLTQLMGCVLQFELGDHCDSERQLARVPELNILPNQDLIEEEAVALWRERLLGSKRHQAQMQFLRAAVILETYGFDYYPVRDHQRQRAYLLGFNYAGVKTIRNGRIVHHFRWHSLSKISYERRMIIFHIYPTENSKRKQILGFKCLSNEDCQNLYMRLLEQKYFFTVDLAYFDKSVQRPSCLYGSSSPGSALDWTPDEVEMCADCEPTSSSVTPERRLPEGCSGRGLSESVSLQPEALGSLADLWRSAAHLDTSPTARLRRQQQVSRSLEADSPSESADPTAATQQNQDVGQCSRLLSSLESKLGLSLLGHDSAESNSSNISDFTTTLGDRPTGGRRLVVSALRLCLAILAINLALRVTDSFSSALIELLSSSTSS